MNQKLFMITARRASMNVMVALVAALLIFVAVGPASAAVGDTAVVTAGQMNVRSGPGAGYPAVAQVVVGDKVTLLGRTGDSSWVKVRLADGVTEGWVSTFYIKASSPISSLPVLAESQPWGLITSPVANVRSGPGLAFDAITTISQGTFVTLLGRNATSTWIKVMVSGVEGWVGRGVIGLSVGVLTLPVVESPAAPEGGSGGGGTAVATEPSTGGETPAVTPTAVITTGQLNVRSGAGPGFSVVAKVFQGDKVELLGRNLNSSWVYVKLADGTLGWISSFYIIANVPLKSLPSLADVVATGLITTGTANLRATPSLTGTVLTTLNHGTFVGVLGRTADSAWIKVSASGVEGWVGAATISVNVPISSLPVLTAATPTPAP